MVVSFLLLHSALHDINHDMVLLKLNVSIIKSRQADIHRNLTSQINVRWLNDQREQRRTDRQLILWQKLMILSGEFEMRIRVDEFCSSNIVWDYDWGLHLCIVTYKSTKEMIADLLTEPMQAISRATRPSAQCIKKFRGVIYWFWLIHT